MSDANIRIVIVDDHKLFIDGMVAILRWVPEFEMVGQATDGKEALEVIEKTKPDVLISDISMPGMKGDELAALVTKKFPKVNILALSMHNDFPTIDRMMKAGVKGYILKNTGRKELVEAIKTVYRGENFYANDIKDLMLNHYRPQAHSPNSSQSFIDDDYQKISYLTKREKQIIKCIVDGLSSAEIGVKVGLSVNTIKSYRRNIYVKLRVKNTAGLIDFINQNNLSL